MYLKKSLKKENISIRPPAGLITYITDLDEFKQRLGIKSTELDHCLPADPAAGHYRGNHLGEGPYRRPPESGFFADLGHAMAGHRVDFLGHCQFLPCLESFEVDGERGAGI